MLARSQSIAGKGVAESSPKRIVRSRSQNAEASAWEVRLRLGQVVVLWALTGGLLLAAFLFGVFAGRRQGVQIALDSYGREGLRLPIVNPVSPDTESREVYQGISQPQGAATRVAPENEQKVDFSTKTSLTALQQSAAEPAASTKADAKEKPTAAPRSASTPAVSPESGVAVFGNASLSKDAKGASAAEAKSSETTSVASSPTSNPEKIALGEGWYVQVAAAKTLAESVTLTNKLKALNYAAKLDEAHVKDVTYYRILVGPYPSRETSMDVREKISRARVSRGEPFIRAIRN